jgi:hypothetical protein
VPGATIGIIGTGVASTTDADEAGGMPPEECHSLDRHLRMSPLLGNRVTPVPAQLRRGPRWFARLGRRETWLSTGNLRPPVSVTAATRTALQGCSAAHLEGVGWLSSVVPTKTGSCPG